MAGFASGSPSDCRLLPRQTDIYGYNQVCSDEY
nr:MAG TPA_asm: hypothetical protein [Caudoviricetes sp.]